MALWDLNITAFIVCDEILPMGHADTLGDKAKWMGEAFILSILELRPQDSCQCWLSKVDLGLFFSSPPYPYTDCWRQEPHTGWCLTPSRTWHARTTITSDSEVPIPVTHGCLSMLHERRLKLSAAVCSCPPRPPAARTSDVSVMKSSPKNKPLANFVAKFQMRLRPYGD